MKKNLNILSYFSFRSLFMGIGLSKLLIESHEYFIFVIIFGTLLGLLFIKITNKSNNKIINILSNFILLVILLIILINMISTMYLTDMNRLLIGLPIILLLIYQMNKDSINIFRVSNILFILNILLFSIAMITLFKYLDISNLSYSNVSKFNIIKCSLEYALYSTVPFIITNNNKYKPIKMYIISNITLSLWFIFVYLILGYNLINIFKYPEYIILKKVSISTAIENIENIVSFMWIFDIYALMMNATNNIKNKVNNKYILYSLLFIILIITCIISIYYQLIIYLYNYCYLILLGLLILHLLIQNKKED